MNQIQVRSLPMTDAGEVRRSLNARSVWLVAGSAALFLLVVNVFFRESYSGDEGFYGVTALNMLRSPDYIVRPSYYPAGDFLADKEGFAHPPFNSYFYAVSLWVSRGALAGPELVSVLSFALLLYFAYRIVSLFDVQAGRFCILLLAASPAILVSYSQLEAEPLMTTFGIMALYCTLRTGMGRGEMRWFFMAGLCLGFSFALKLWLCGPLGLAVLAALVIRARQWEGALRKKVLLLFLLGIAFLVPAGSHLLAIWWVHPQDIGFWLQDIYFGFFTSAGISGDKLSGAGVSSSWVHPFWYYGPAIYRDCFFLAPVILLGLGSALREERVKTNLLWIIGAGLFGLAPLSLIKVKEPLYVLSCVIFIYFLAGICLAALARRIESGAEIDWVSTRLGPVVILALTILFPLAYARGIQPGKITGAFVIAHTIIFSLLVAVFLWSRRRKAGLFFEWSVFGVCAMAVLTAFGYDCMTRRPTDKIIALLTQPYVQGNAPNTLSMIASNFKSYQFYSYRQGCYWHELPLEEGPEAVLGKPRFSNVRAFILDPEEQQKAQIAPWLGWLKTHAVEKTAELNAKLGRASGFRLFVRGSEQTERHDHEVGLGHQIVN